LGISATLAVHAFAFGGIGLITLGMMSRVSLGHTGRSVLDPPKASGPMFALLIAGALTRVFGPLVDGVHHVYWVGASQVLWMLAFGWFSMTYLPILIRPRIDGRRD